MPEPLVLGIDLGTSALKCGVWDLDGRRFGAVRVPYPTRTQGATVEQDAADWWAALVAGVRGATAGLDRDRVAALAVGGHAPSPVLVDSDLNPVAPVLPWSDPRSAGHHEWLLRALGRPPRDGPERLAAQIAARTSWLRDEEPHRFARAARVLHSGDYLAARLTGRCFTSSPGAPEIFAAAGLPTSLIPTEEHEAGGRVAGIEPAAAREVGLPAGALVVAGGLDSFLGSAGSGICEPGDACLQGGSSPVVALLARPPAAGRFELGGYPLLSRPVRITGDPAAVALAQRQALEELAASHGPVARVRSVGGPAARPEWNQLRADVLGMPVEVPRETDSGALGAAMLAAIAAGFLAGHREAAARMVGVARVYRPAVAVTGPGPAR